MLKHYKPSYDEHVHTHEQWVIPLGGELDVNINGEHFLIADDKSAFIPEYTLHRFRSNTNKAFIVIDTHRLVRGLDLPYQFKLDDNGKLLQKLAFKTLGDSKITYSKNSFYNLFIEIFANQFSLNKEKHIEQAKQFIITNLSKEFDLTHLAQYCHLSVRQLQRKFNKELGISIQTYIRSQRIDKARQILKYTSTPISTVAEMVGFKSPSAFARAFRELTQLTPLQYKRCHIQHKC